MATQRVKNDVTVGVFRSEAAAKQAVAQLRAQGFDESTVHVVADTDHQRNEAGDISDKNVTRSNAGYIVGALIGAVVGLLIGVVLSSGLVPLPELIRGVGPIGMILILTAIGTALGALGGSMAGLNQAHQTTKGLEKAVESGRWLVSLEHHDVNAARGALQKVGAVDMRVQSPESEPVKPKSS